MISCVLCTSVKVTALFLAEKIPSEYWNNRSWLMSLRTRFWKGSFQVAKRLINQFLLFQYSCVYFSAKRKNSWTFYSSIKRAWLAVYCVQVSKKEPSFWPRKSPLNFETKEFCQWVWKLCFSRVPSNLPKSSLTNFYCFNIHAFISLRKRGIPRHSMAR